jgi:hypothetical protein
MEAKEEQSATLLFDCTVEPAYKDMLRASHLIRICETFSYVSRFVRKELFEKSHLTLENM